MPGQVVKVRRRERLTLAGRLYLPMIFLGLWITGRHFVRNLWGYIVGRKKTFVVQYPEEQLDYADAFRGHPVLVALESGEPKCVACGLCEFACPTDCIAIVPAEIDAGIERYPEVFDIDLSRCMFCGLCEEACPEEAIVMSRDVDISAYDRAATLYHKKDLLRTEEQLGRRLEYVRAGYDR
jgi:NADH-quinone oxidoreductase subunit I